MVERCPDKTEVEGSIPSGRTVKSKTTFELTNSSKRRFKAIASIIFRNVFLLVYGIIFSVVILLAIFGDTREGIFLGFITLFNIILECTQEINAWLTLEKLQLSAIPKVTRVNGDNTESVIVAEEAQEKDKIKLKIGDQVPCDGAIMSSHGFGVNEAMITGESTTFFKKPGDKIFAGSIVTSGSCILEVEKIFAESRIALMTKAITKFSLVQSPIQFSISQIIKYTGYGLLIIIFFVIGRGFFINESTVNIVQNIGALTSVLLPQGMVVIITLLFSYGAAHMYRKNVLLQEINATEKIGRIKNLCMDKTGTLTDNNLIIEHMYTAPDVSEQCVAESIAAYIKSTGDSSQTITVIKKMFPSEYSGTIVDDLTFSSSRQFGAVHIKDKFGERVVFAGAPDIFLPFLTKAEDKAWVQKYIDTEAKIGKRLMCFVQSDSNVLPQDLSGTKLTIISIFILNNNLREGVKEAIEFFQARGVVIRIISGDNPETVETVATAAGVNNSHAVVTGADLEKWTDADFLKNLRTFAIFARIKPEQKEKIIEFLKQDGFTAMIGDGANDALAIKKADLGIAMFDGSQATRQIASIVLVKNSFSDLPDGVKLADSIIQNIEICASIFFNQIFLSLFFFLMLTVTGYSFPFTPLNITFITYFTIGLPVFLVFYWIIRPVRAHVVRNSESFLKQVIPFAFISAIPQAVVAVLAFYSSLAYVKNDEPTSLVMIIFIMLGVIFFMYTPSVYSGSTTKVQKEEFFLLVVVEVICVIALLKIPLVAVFFNLNSPSFHSVLQLIPLVFLYALGQYGVTRWFLKAQLSGPVLSIEKDI